MKLSIIIPAYNVEQYIEKCLISTQVQEVEKGAYEVLVIVDGAKDRSLEIAQNVARRYTNIRVIYQENEGLSGARNNGLKAAIGEYVWFVDSDDWIEENCLTGIFQKLDGKLDILQLQRRLTYDDEPKKKELSIISINDVITGVEVLTKYRLPAPAQFRIYRRSFLLDNDLWFYKGILHEDSEFMPRTVYLAQLMTSYDKVAYNYYQRSSGNIMSSFKIRNVRDLLTVNNSLYRFSEPFKRKVKKEFNRLIGLNQNSIVSGFKLLSNGDKNEAIRLLNSNRHLYYRMLLSGKVTYVFEGVFFLISVRLALYVYSKLKK
ncbi:glycosyltransferase family 2 protein [Bacteroides pyogenes]|uniref:glycosyltransferase family 2 protein n=1 Tax=Bacteroides pyogenes TaxID=310300 RepID=UPI003F9F49A2